MSRSGYPIQSLADEITLFTTDSGSRELNDESNKKREEILSHLFSGDIDREKYFLQHSKFATTWLRIRTEINSKIVKHLDAHLDPNLVDLRLSWKGGRGKNYDFDASLLQGKKVKLNNVKLEFKRGSSLKSQPQFWSPQAKRGNLIRENIQSYAEFVYDGYIDSISEVVNVRPPGRDEYLKQVFGTDYDQHDFFLTLHKASKSSKASKERLRKIQYESIDSYLNALRTDSSSIDLVKLQMDLSRQLEKHFCSWDSSRGILFVERFDSDDMKLRENIFIKNGKEGLANSIIFITKSGKSISALLRWRNHPCVLNPAWQIDFVDQDISNKPNVVRY